MKEVAFRYGENNRGLGVLTLPDDPEGAPILVLLNAGLLYRAEPYRLNVLVARTAASLGYIALRVDLSGKGDTPARDLVNRESVALDWSLMKEALQTQFGPRPMLVFGLCSGADNGIKIAAFDDSVRGLILLDPVSPTDDGFRRRDLLAKLANVQKWKRIPVHVWQKLTSGFGGASESLLEPTSLRDEPTAQDLNDCFERLVASDGRVLAVFTSHAHKEYNQLGQFGRALGVDGAATITEEVYLPTAGHLYPVQEHRERLIRRIGRWCSDHRDDFVRDR